MSRRGKSHPAEDYTVSISLTHSITVSLAVKFDLKKKTLSRVTSDVPVGLPSKSLISPPIKYMRPRFMGNPKSRDLSCYVGHGLFLLLVRPSTI